MAQQPSQLNMALINIGGQTYLGIAVGDEGVAFPIDWTPDVAELLESVSSVPADARIQ